MTTGEGQAPRDGQAPKEAKDERDRSGGQRIGVGAADDTVAKIQLAARWAESYTPTDDSLAAVLKRFRGAFEYLDAVIHGVEPPELARELADAKPGPAATEPAPEPEPEPTPAPAYVAPTPSPELPDPS